MSSEEINWVATSMGVSLTMQEMLSEIISGGK